MNPKMRCALGEFRIRVLLSHVAQGLARSVLSRRGPCFLECKSFALRRIVRNFKYAHRLSLASAFLDEDTQPAV